MLLWYEKVVRINIGYVLRLPHSSKQNMATILRQLFYRRSNKSAIFICRFINNSDPGGNFKKSID